MKKSWFVDYLPNPYLLGVFVGGILFTAIKLDLITWQRDLVNIGVILFFGRIADMIDKAKTGSQPVKEDK